MKPTVSIIVPVYNAEKFLNRCVDSILGQEYRDFELILVDDGSRDMSGSICDAYAKTDERVVVIHKENSGVSDTRNQGIERAKGTYLQFVDSDDWLTPDATKLMVRAAEEHGDLRFLPRRWGYGIQKRGHRVRLRDRPGGIRVVYDGESGGLLLWSAVE